MNFFLVTLSDHKNFLLKRLKINIFNFEEKSQAYEGIVEIPAGKLATSIVIELPESEESEDEAEFTVRLLNPICDEEVSIANPNESRVKIVNDLISNQVGFKVASTKINVRQSEGTISIPLERTGAVGTVSWIKWKIDGPPHFEGLNQDGMATFQANQCDGVIMLNLPQKPISEVNEVFDFFKTSISIL